MKQQVAHRLKAETVIAIFCAEFTLAKERMIAESPASSSVRELELILNTSGQMLAENPWYVLVLLETSIGYLGRVLTKHTSQTRYQGYLVGLEKNGLVLDESIVRHADHGETHLGVALNSLLEQREVTQGLEYGVLAHEESLLIDVFSPLREDLLGVLR